MPRVRPPWNIPWIPCPVPPPWASSSFLPFLSRGNGSSCSAHFLRPHSECLPVAAPENKRPHYALSARFRVSLHKCRVNWAPFWRTSWLQRFIRSSHAHLIGHICPYLWRTIEHFISQICSYGCCALKQEAPLCIVSTLQCLYMQKCRVSWATFWGLHDCKEPLGTRNTAPGPVLPEWGRRKGGWLRAKPSSRRNCCQIGRLMLCFVSKMLLLQAAIFCTLPLLLSETR